jgi:hypothetical protein
VASDNAGGSGVQKIEYSFDNSTWQTYTNPFTVNTQGTTTLYYRSVDNMNNIEETKTQEINIDKTPPSISGAATSSPNTNGWYKDNVVIHFTAADDGSGIETVTSDQTITTEGANQSVTGEASDKAGNTASTTVSGINIDKNPPTITINIPNGSYILNQTVLADWAAIDGLSGLELSSGTVPSGSAINTSTPDTKEFSVTAKDKAGNEVTKTVQYKILYDFTGLLPPIKDGKEFKSGSTIPVKFQLKDVNGQFIASAVAKLYLIDSNGQEITPSGNANPGNLFRYDTSDNQYIYNLTTKGLSAGNWQLKIVLDDGSLKSFTIVLR